MTTDLELLQDYARKDSQDSFSELVGRHLNLVYSAALRQVRSPQLAEEVSQCVFSDLARNASRLAADTILPAWLYQVTRRTAIDVVRRESRRQLREQLASELAAMNATASDWSSIAPLLDEGMSALEETDRTALLLRFFENKSLREVGKSLGTSEDAAQKRVSRAVERLREFLAEHGITVGASALTLVISANAVQAAPTGLVLTISAGAMVAGIAGTTAPTSAALAATKTITMTALQKTIIGTAVIAAVGTGIYQARENFRLRDQVHALQQEQTPLANKVQQMERERADASNRLTAFRAENQQLKSNATELARLRNEVGHLRSKEGMTGRSKAESGDRNAAAIMRDPDMKAALNSEAKAAIDKNLRQLFDGGLAQELQLNDEQTAALKDLLRKRISIFWENIILPMTTGDLSEGDLKESGHAIKQAFEENLAQLREFLGPDKFASYQRFEKTNSERDKMIEFQPRFKETGQTLTPGQQKQLLAAMVEERANFNFQFEMGDPSQWNYDNLYDNFTDDKITTHFKEQEELNRRTLEKAQAILSAGQMDVLKNLMAEQLQKSKMTARMTTAMFVKKH